MLSCDYGVGQFRRGNLLMRPDQRTCGRWDKSKCQDGIDRHLPILVRNEPITTRAKMKQRLGERRGICGMENMGKRCETGVQSQCWHFCCW